MKGLGGTVRETGRYTNWGGLREKVWKSPAGKRELVRRKNFTIWAGTKGKK